MIDWFNVGLVVLIIFVVGFILNAIRKTRAEIEKGLGPAPSERIMRKVIEEIRNRDVNCPRCGQQTSAMMGTINQYKCDMCNHEFEGPDHIQRNLSHR
jgi:ribosomal protein L37AE/L43A